MSTLDTGMQSGTPGGLAGHDEPRGSGWVLFAGIMLMLAGILNVIYGIAAIGNSSFFVHDTRYILSGLNTWGWVMLILGALQVAAAYSVWAGNRFGVWFGIAVAGLNSIGALLSIPANPFGSRAVCAVDVLVINGLAPSGGQRRPI
ncbi:MAG: DUF7144 family membrane protein [Solirubrobacteraceae bacterium]